MVIVNAFKYEGFPMTRECKKEWIDLQAGISIKELTRSLTMYMAQVYHMINKGGSRLVLLQSILSQYINEKYKKEVNRRNNLPWQ